MLERKLEPFKMRPLVLTDALIRDVGQVTSLEFIDPTTREFHDRGLFSLKIFGQVGSPEREVRFGYIDIKLPVFNPTMFIALTRLRDLYQGIMSGLRYATWDREKRDFVEADITTGQTGFHFFVKHWAQINHVETGSVERRDRIELLRKHAKSALIHRIPVMPAAYREMEIADDGRTSSDEVNDIYRKLIAASNAVPANFNESYADLLDSTRWRLQRLVLDIYTYFESMTRDKGGFYRARFLARRVHDSTRNVISAAVSRNTRLSGPGTIRMMDNVVGLYQAYALVRPATLFHLKRRFIEPSFVSQEVPVRLINPKTLEQVEVDVPAQVYDDWMTNEGLNRQLGYFESRDVRHDPVVIAGHYLALVYKGELNGKKVFKVFHDVREMPKGFSRKQVTPITFAELLYVVLGPIIKKYPSLNVRYPIDNFGSNQPNNLYLRSTVVSELRLELNNEWELDDETWVAEEFPVMGQAFHDTSSPHLFRLAAQNGDWF